MKMKFVYSLLLLMLVAVWAHPDYSESDDDDGRSVTTVQKARLMTGDISRNNSNENRKVTKVRRKRGIFGVAFRATATAAKTFIKALIKNVPRAVSSFSKIVGKVGKAMEYVEVGITVVQAISECPAVNICPLKEELKTIQDHIYEALKTLNQTHTRLRKCTVKANRVYHSTQLILSHIKHITQSLVYITEISELRYLESMDFVCAKENDTMIKECLEEKINDIEFVYSRMAKRLNDIKHNNMMQAVISFVVQKTISVIIGNIGNLSKKKYDFLVYKFGKPKSKFKKFKMITKAIISGQKGRGKKALTSVQNAVLYPVKTLKNKLGRVSHKMRSLKRRVVNKFVHPRQGYKRLWNNINPRKFSVSSVIGGFAKGSFSSIISAVSIYLEQKKYVELEDDLRVFIHDYQNNLKQLNETIAEGIESETNCTQYFDYSIGLFINESRTVVETLELFDHMIPNTTALEEIDLTQFEIKTALYRNVSAILLGNVDKGNIHLKQNELLHILENDFFNMTEMKSWVHTENTLFDVVQEGIHDSSVSILRMCYKLKYVGLHTTGRGVNWPIQDVLCHLALFHPSHKEFDYYNMENISDYCRRTPDSFPLNTVLLDRKNTLVQETIRRNVESSEDEDTAKLSDEISRDLGFDEYMKLLGKFPDEKEVLCNIAEMFPQRFKYAFYDLADFRPRSTCSLLTTEKFEQLQLDAIETRNEMKRYQILLSPDIFNTYLNKTIRKGLKDNVPISSIFQDIRRSLTVADVRRNDNWPFKEILCALGSVAPLEMYVYDHYPVDVIRNQCQSGTLLTSQLQDILLKRKENLLELNIRRYVDFEEEENPEAMVKEFSNLLMSDLIMESLDISPTEHEMICMVADLYPGKKEYGMYRLNQFRPMEVCEQITEQGFQILTDERERRKWEAMLSKYCSDSDEPCFPMTRKTSEDGPPAQHYFSQSGTWSCHATRNVFIVMALFALQCIMEWISVHF
ncbi:uncharacterized protein LOC110447737 [Mizuhopecten yessoensis]|uniref:uncharacterized protein LOC110447737 n=1 Tax=Mizuhopecten yessoensis TaxID=6573 RepID=UPI000B45C245|nr:uncharacterized protein LOC110447737 [Mizuhopecten yessoensis]